MNDGSEGTTEYYARLRQERAERAIGDDPSRQARPTTDDPIVAESP